MNDGTSLQMQPCTLLEILITSQRQLTKLRFEQGFYYYYYYVFGSNNSSFAEIRDYKVYLRTQFISTLILSLPGCLW